MIILELYQNNYSKDLVAFDSIEDGKAFVSQIPGYTLETEDGFEVEYFNPKNIPDYMEIIFNGNIVPLSKFMFDPEENVDIIWKEISKDYLEISGYEVDRSFFGSEDGEAILYRKKGSEDWHFLCHLDPMFVEIEDVEEYVKEELEGLM